MKFVFLLTIWAADAEPQVYVEDYGLTGEDCIALMESFHLNPIRGASPSCEIDHAELPAVFQHKGQEIALPPCPAEDSQNCYWDAGMRGNGLGTSFYDVNGEMFTFQP